MLPMEVCLHSYFRWCGYFLGPQVSFVTTDSSREGHFNDQCLMISQTTFLFLTYFELFLALQISEAFIQNFVIEYFLESNSANILVLSDTNLDDSIDSGNFPFPFVFLSFFSPQYLFYNGFPPSGNSDHVVMVSRDCPSNSQWDPPFQCIAYYYSCADCHGLYDHFRDVSWKDISASATASQFCWWVQVGTNAYIPDCNIMSSLTHLHGFQLLVLLPQFIEITFFISTNRKNLMNLKSSLNRLIIVAKRFLKLPNLHMSIKQKSPSLPRNLAHGTFDKLLIVFSTNVNLLYLLHSTTQRCCPRHRQSKIVC